MLRADWRTFGFAVAKTGLQGKHSCYLKADARGRKANPGVTSGICTKGPAPPAPPPPPPPPSCSADGSVCVKYNDGSDVASAVALAETADVVLVFVATSSSEGRDRRRLMTHHFSRKF